MNEKDVHQTSTIDNLHLIAASISDTSSIYNEKFTWYDYSFFTIMLAASALIGVYFGFYKKQETMKDYLFGGKNMGVLPISMSMTANAVSGISLLAIPADIYRYGTAYWFGYPATILIVVLSYFVFLPVFFKLQITSTFHYLKLRFDTKTRLLGSLLYGIYSFLYLPIVIYVPALALAQATGLHLHVITWLVCIVCIFYTSVGGLKAVVYSDTLQFILIMSSLLIVFVMGTYKAGGIWNVLNIAYENERFSIPADFDLTKRDTLWSGTIGILFTWLYGNAINQVLIQKCLALPSRKHIKTSLILYCIGIFIIGTLCVTNGLLIYAYFWNCDPVESGILEKHDQLIPFYIINILKIPGLPGLFIAGIFSAALSTLSGSMNGLSGTIYEDFIGPRLSKKISESTKSKILKLIAVLIGAICTVLVSVVEHLGGILALSNSLLGVTTGTIVGLFSVGMLIPMVNSKGAYYGGLTTLTIMTVIVGGYQWNQSQGNLVYPTLPISVEGCSNSSILLENLNKT
nr:sodium-coupled monocarboxylate transporter 2-like [Onthophagus taurus]